MKKHSFLLILLSLIAFSCKKKKEETILSPEPVIQLVKITPTTVLQFKDSVLLTIHYKDNNGDIGDQNPDTYSLRVKDSRLAETDWYHVQPLTPNGQEIQIEGTIKIKINTLFLLGNGSQEETSLSIKLKDRAGHWSNELVSPPIVIKDSI